MRCCDCCAAAHLVVLFRTGWIDIRVREFRACVRAYNNWPEYGATRVMKNNCDSKNRRSPFYSTQDDRVCTCVFYICIYIWSHLLALIHVHLHNPNAVYTTTTATYGMCISYRFCGYLIFFGWEFASSDIAQPGSACSCSVLFLDACPRLIVRARWWMVILRVAHVLVVVWPRIIMLRYRFVM